MKSLGQEMYDLCVKLFPYCRSITGEGVRRTLRDLQEVCSRMNIYEVPSGTQAFDWTVPKEWNIRDAWIKNEQDEKILDFKENNLHVMGYSLPVDKTVSLSELKEILYTQPDQPDAIPYVTSYYKERYGFCMTDRQKASLPEGMYHIYIDSELKKGSLTYGEIFLPGETEKEIFLSTYICHPSMANNELSGPSVVIHLAEWLSTLSKHRYSYRIIFVPETIGAIVYLSRNLQAMKKNVVAGFNVSCVGDDRTYSYVASRYGNTLADRVAKNVLRFHYPTYKEYSFLQRASDERQYNAPGVDLPVVSICRSKFGEYPEYHTSQDNLGLISPAGLFGAYEVLQKCVEALEGNRFYRATCICEPQMGKRGLYATTSQRGSSKDGKRMIDLIDYADSTNDLLAISDIINMPMDEMLPMVQMLVGYGLLQEYET